MGKWLHRISEVDKENKTAECSNCGLVKVKYKKNNTWACGERIKTEDRSRAFRRRYNLDLERGLVRPKECSLCGGITRIAYDHNHKTGKFRGWLCIKCNTALGLVNDDIELLNKMIAYLQI